MATEISVARVTIPAAGDLTGQRWSGVVVDANGRVALAGAGVAIDGILQDEPAAIDRAAAVETGRGAISMVRAGAAFSAGDNLTVDANGDFITAVGASGNAIIAKALSTTGGAGEIGTALFTGFTGVA